MTTWVIGDVHGQAETLSVMLDKMSLSSVDRCVFLGDYLNKGPDAPAVIRLIKSLPNVRYVLGNHDLHGLAIYYGYKRSGERGLGYEQINRQADRDDLWAWLAAGELMLVDEDAKWIAVHAGLSPFWRIEDIQQILAIKSRYSWQDLLADDVCNPARVDQGESEIERLQVAVAICTMVRYMTLSGELVWGEYRPPPQQGLLPWYDFDRVLTDYNVFFGHWAAISGFYKPGFRQLDGGAAYGGKLMAFAVEENRLLEVPVVKEL